MPIHHGDLFDVLPGLEAGSVDACVTDPPYGIGFMGREWDTFAPSRAAAVRVKGHAWAGNKPDNPNLNGRRRQHAVTPAAIEYDDSRAGLRRFQEWTEAWAAEVVRVLKPGAYVLVCGAPRSYHRMACGLEDAGLVIRDKLAWLFGQGFPKNYNLGDGTGTALKPAHEPIALAWKPFAGTISACHAAHGTAGLNLEACRVGTEGGTAGAGQGPNDTGIYGDGLNGAYGVPVPGLGRWPANVVIDDTTAAELGEVARYYYCAKPSRGERDRGCYEMAPRTALEAVDRDPGSAGALNPRCGAGGRATAADPIFNHHPTVKPIELMRWLVRLVTPPGGIVLDPFVGSGTTACACALEGRRFVGVERESEYIAIAERRIAQCVPLFADL